MKRRKHQYIVADRKGPLQMCRYVRVLWRGGPVATVFPDYGAAWQAVQRSVKYATRYGYTIRSARDEYFITRLVPWTNAKGD